MLKRGRDKEIRIKTQAYLELMMDLHMNNNLLKIILKKLTDAIPTLINKASE